MAKITIHILLLAFFSEKVIHVWIKRKIRIDEALFLSKNSYKNTLEMDFEMRTRVLFH